MSRLLIKSTLCANDRGVFTKEIKDAQGNVITPSLKVQEPVKFTSEDTVTYNVDKAKKKLTVTVNGIQTELPIDDYSLSLD